MKLTFPQIQRLNSAIEKFGVSRKAVEKAVDFEGYDFNELMSDIESGQTKVAELNKMYDEKIADESYKVGSRVRHLAQETNGTVKKVTGNDLYVEWDEPIIDYRGGSNSATTIDPSVTKIKKISDAWTGIENGVIFYYHNGVFTITHRNGKVETISGDKFKTNEELYEYLHSIKDSATEEEIKEYMKKTGFSYADAKRALEEDDSDFHEKMQKAQYDAAPSGLKLYGIDEEGIEEYRTAIAVAKNRLSKTPASDVQMRNYLTNKINLLERDLKHFMSVKDTIKDGDKDAIVASAERELTSLGLKKVKQGKGMMSGALNQTYMSSNTVDAKSLKELMIKVDAISDKYNSLEMTYSGGMDNNSKAVVVITCHAVRDASVVKDSYYTESEKMDKQFVKNAIEEMEGYINNWSFLTAKQKQDIGASKEQLKARVAELKQVKDSVKDSWLSDLSKKQFKEAKEQKGLYSRTQTKYEYLVDLMKKIRPNFKVGDYVEVRFPGFIAQIIDVQFMPDSALDNKNFAWKYLLKITDPGDTTYRVGNVADRSYCEWEFKQVSKPVFDSIRDAKMTPDRMVQIITPIVREFAKRKGVEDYWQIHKNGKNVSVGIELGYKGLDELCDILNKKLEPLTDSYFEPADGGLIETTIFDSAINDALSVGEKLTNKNGVKAEILSENKDVTGKRYFTFKLGNKVENHPAEDVEHMLEVNGYVKTNDSDIEENVSEVNDASSRYSASEISQIKETKKRLEKELAELNRELSGISTYSKVENSAMGRVALRKKGEIIEKINNCNEAIMEYNLASRGSVKDADTYKFSLNRKKNDYDEYIVKAYKNGRYDEDSTYYTDDWDDAVGTLKDMAKRQGLTVKQSGSTFVADSDKVFEVKYQDKKYKVKAQDEKSAAQKVLELQSNK